MAATTNGAGGETSRDTTTTRVETSGSGSGEGAVLTVVHKVAGDSKETTTTLSSGRESGSSGGHADGIVAANGAGAGTEFDVHSDASGSSSGKTTRTTTVSDPTNRSRAVITRSDTAGGSLTSDGTVATGGGHVEREGDVSGNSQSGAQITFDYTANGDAGGGVFSFGREVGTIYTDLSLNFEGGWDEADLHGEGKRTSGEDSTSTDGWQKYLPDANGFHWSGATTTRTLVTRDQVSTELSEEEEGEGEGEGEDADQAKGPRTTDRVNISSFEIDSHPDDFHGITKNWTSTLTVQQHDDGASESHQVEWVNAERKEYVSSGGHDVEEVKSDKGDHTKTLTLREDQHILEIARNSTTEDKTTESWTGSGSGMQTDTEKTTDNYRYNGSHTVTAEGLAKDGAFEVNHDVVTEFNAYAESDYYKYDDEPGFIPHDNWNDVGLWTRSRKIDKVTRNTTENGSYHDVLEEDKPVRQQSGTYKIVETNSVEWPREENYTKSQNDKFENWNSPDYIIVGSEKGVYYQSYRNTISETVEGNYSPSGASSITTYGGSLKWITEFRHDGLSSDVVDIYTETTAPADHGRELVTTRVKDWTLHWESDNEVDLVLTHLGQQITLEPGDTFRDTWLIDAAGNPVTSHEEHGNPAPGPQTVNHGPHEAERFIAGFDRFLPKPIEAIDGINFLDTLLLRAERGVELSAQEILYARVAIGLGGPEVSELSKRLGPDALSRALRLGLLEPGVGSGPADVAGIIDNLQTGLDIVGLSPDPVLGPLADVTNALISASRGQWGAAGLSIVAVVPLFGDLIGKGGKLVKGAAEHGDEVAAFAQPARVVIDVPSTVPLKRGPSIDPNAPHNATIRIHGDLLEAGGNKILRGGGREKEILIRTPGGIKTGRRPDILFETANGQLRGRNIGHVDAAGNPLKRELEALLDLNGPGGLPTDFVPF